MTKKYRNGNGVFASMDDAKGKEAETLRATIKWNGVRMKLAESQGRVADAARHAENRAKCQMGLLRIAQGQAA